MCSFLAHGVIEYMQCLLCLQKCTIELCKDTQVLFHILVCGCVFHLCGDSLHQL